MDLRPVPVLGGAGTPLAEPVRLTLDITDMDLRVELEGTAVS